MHFVAMFLIVNAFLAYNVCGDDARKCLAGVYRRIL